MFLTSYRNKQKAAERYILKHLEQHAHPGDTLAGITNCWLEQTRVEIAVEEVAEALAELVKKGMVRKFELGAETYFSKNRPEENTNVSQTADQLKK